MESVSKSASSLRHFPQHITPFVGRQSEVASIVSQLEDPYCRLITLIGPGGIGKTRLAAQVADSAAGHFNDGCIWINLQPLSSAELIVPTIAERLSVVQSGNDSALSRLSAHLRHREVLLVLDNFEHLLDGAPLLTALLAAAPRLKMLVTSREALNLREEWVHYLDGLSYPTRLDVEDIERYAAVELFAASARRASSTFNLEVERDAVLQICSHVAGMPLALELAAAWTRTLRCADIVEEIQKGLDLFSTQMRNVPERQRNMRCIFEQTCDMLSDDEQTIFAKLSVFRHSFSREAAEYVAGASLSHLSALIDKSLLKRDQEGRFHMHELVRQFAAERLSRDAAVSEKVSALHSAYYMNFLGDWETDLLWGRQNAAREAIRRDVDNVRGAWQWAVEYLAVELIERAATMLANFYQFQSLYQEGADIFERTALRLSQANPFEQLERTLILIKGYQAGFYLRVGRLMEAEQVLHECEAIYQRLGIPPVPGVTTDPAFYLGTLSLIRGNYAEAMQYGEKMRRESETRPHRSNRQLAYHLLAEAAIGSGDYGAAQHYAQQSLALVTASGNRWFMAYTYNQLGTIARALCDYATARQYYQASFTIREDANDSEGMALALSLLGEVAVYQNAYADAEQYFERSMTIYSETNDRGGLAKVLNSAAIVAMVNSDLSLARERLKQVLEIAVEMQYTSLLLFCVMNIAELFVHIGDKARASELLALVASHPAASHETLTVLRSVAQQHKLSLPSGADVSNFDATVSQLLLAFPEVKEEAETIRQSHAPYTPKFRQALIDPLSEREQEVLYQIGKGISNREIADELIITVGTVKSHVNSIYGKLGVNNRVQALARARELSLV